MEAHFLYREGTKMLLQSSLFSILGEPTPEIYEEDSLFDATITGMTLLQKLQARGLSIGSGADFMLRYASDNLPEEQSVFCRYALVQPREVLQSGQLDLFDPNGYHLWDFFAAAKAKGFLPLPAVAAAMFPWETLPYIPGEPLLVHLAMQPIPDGGGGHQVLSFSRKKTGEASLIAFRWHESIADLLSNDTPWVMGA